MASGLSVTAAVEYAPTDDVQLKDRLVVTVDGEVMEVPIFGWVLDCNCTTSNADILEVMHHCSPLLSKFHNPFET